MNNILITGANGQVGSELRALAKDTTQDTFLFTDAADLDITNEVAVKTYFANHNITVCINCAAFTAVDKAESEPDLAWKVNTKGAQNLALACAKNDALLIHLSTDYVYHNNQNTPFIESDFTNPQGIYAKTKLEGDQMAMRLNPKTLILRTSWVYSSFGNNFVKTMIRLGNERDALNVIFDQIGTPTYAKDIASTCLSIIQSIDNQDIVEEKWKGVFHYSNEGVTSWYDFAHAIFQIKGIRCDLKAIETKDYPTPASRPHFSVLNKTKIKQTFGISIPHWRDSLEACLQLL